jgi:hypothetical protein
LSKFNHLAVKFRLLLGPQRLHRQDALAYQLEAGVIAGAVVFHLLDVPAAADSELEAPARQTVEAGDLLGGDDRVALGNEADADAEAQFLRDRSGERQCDERVVRVGIARRQLATPGDGLLRLTGTWVCSGTNSDSKPRSSSARANSAMSMP